MHSTSKAQDQDDLRLEIVLSYMKLLMGTWEVVIVACVFKLAENDSDRELSRKRVVGCPDNHHLRSTVSSAPKVQMYEGKENFLSAEPT